VACGAQGRVADSLCAEGTPPRLRLALTTRCRKPACRRRRVAEAAALGVALGEPMPLFGASFVLSNIVSNVPAVMLLLPAATHTLAVTAG
jgi:hypothetical protein